MTFLLGLPLALGAVLALQRDRPRLAVLLALATGLTGPVDAAFLALAGLSVAIAAPRGLTASRTGTAGSPVLVGLAVALAAGGPVLLLTLVFPEGGTEPFVPSAFWPAFISMLVFALLLPKNQRVLRAGVLLYALAVAACFVIPSAVGGNITRLAALAGGPLFACTNWPRRSILVVALALPFVYWQLMPAVRDVAITHDDPSTEASYYAPLVAELHRLDPTGSIRIEVPFTRSHWEGARLAPHVALARGWERQLDRQRNALFYDGTPLTAARYTAWLHSNAVSYVAVPDAILDISATDEAALIARGVPGLTPMWRSAHWTLYRVAHPTPIGVTRLEPDGFTLTARHPGVQTIRVRFSPHWAVVSGSGCVSRSPDDYTLVRATRAETIRVAPRIDPVRALLRRTGERCHDAPVTTP